MAPANLTECLILLERINSSHQHTTSSPNTTAQADTEKSEFQALLYIVVTLLFYSLGIIVGIVSYLKREKREMEEDRIYDQFIAARQDSSWSTKQEKVQQVINRLQFLENEKIARLKCGKSSENETESLLQSDHLLRDTSSHNKDTESDHEASYRSIHFKPMLNNIITEDFTVKSSKDISEKSSSDYAEEPHRSVSYNEHISQTKRTDCVKPAISV